MAPAPLNRLARVTITGRPSQRTDKQRQAEQTDTDKQTDRERQTYENDALSSEHHSAYKWSVSKEPLAGSLKKKNTQSAAEEQSETRLEKRRSRIHVERSLDGNHSNAIELYLQ